MPISQVPFAGISNPVDFRNIVINGDMQIAQRSTSVASITTSGYNTCDRWKLDLSSLGTWTQSQSTDVPSGYGFASSLKMDCTTANATPVTSNRLIFSQSFEGFNIQYLKKGTANALPLTLSFWVKSTKTGTFIAELTDGQVSTRSISKSYTVSVTNTWEYKTISFPGDTGGSTLANDNTAQINCNFWLGAGSTFTSGTLATSWGSLTAANRAVGQVNCADSTSNDFLITGVQLEAGEQASGFEFMPIDVNLARCQRYYEIFYLQDYSVAGQAYSTSAVLAPLKFAVQKRATPTATLPAVGISAGTIIFTASNAANPSTTSGSIAASELNVSKLTLNGTGFTSSYTAGNVSLLYSSGGSQIKIDSEL